MRPTFGCSKRAPCPTAISEREDCHREEDMPCADRRIRGYFSQMSLLPEDPLVRWVIWLMVAVSVGAPLLAGLILLIVK
jgi:hypothetical protein